ncbi:MAG: hypothetical protein OXP71_02430 [Candidatus Poribacteria bacterium]|nr:hypothetical protein [Candidatus Poribacteria bacterium]
MAYLFQILGTDFLEAYGICFAVLSIIVHVCFAVAVFCDAKRLPEKPVLVWPIIWSFAILAGGVLVVFFYWVIHHSRLPQWIGANSPEDSNNSEDAE